MSKIECPKHEGGFDCTPFCELCEGEQEIQKPKDYTLTTWANGFGIWHCRIDFAYPGLGNTGEAERVAANAIRAAKRKIRREIEEQENINIKRLSYEVKANETQLGSGRLLSLTIAEK
jgi:hypothetical protein